MVLSKLYANSMMVFLNDRILGGHDSDGQAISLETMTGAFGSMRFGTLPGPADVVQEQVLEGCNDVRGSTSGQTAVHLKKNSCRA